MSDKRTRHQKTNDGIQLAGEAVGFAAVAIFGVIFLIVGGLSFLEYLTANPLALVGVLVCGALWMAGEERS